MNKNKQLSEGMVDISEKNITKRIAVATSTISMNQETFHSLMDGRSPKGDVFETAKVAGIMAAKSTPQIIPLCHPLSLNKVNISFETNEKECLVKTKAEVVCDGKTGVEMEALMAATAASLTIYDMMKWADKAMVIGDVQLEYKSGGKSGTYQRDMK